LGFHEELDARDLSRSPKVKKICFVVPGTRSYFTRIEEKTCVRMLNSEGVERFSPWNIQGGRKEFDLENSVAHATMINNFELVSII
jgi:hypothetical protein